MRHNEYIIGMRVALVQHVFNSDTKLTIGQTGTVVKINISNTCIGVNWDGLTTGNDLGGSINTYSGLAVHPDALGYQCFCKKLNVFKKFNREE